jgi:hypothetical protein
MSVFVWLTNSGERKVKILVNLSKVTTIEPYNSGTILYFTESHYETVDETMETIANILRHHHLLE